jgi:hypothetical protein
VHDGQHILSGEVELQPKRREGAGDDIMGMHCFSRAAMSCASIACCCNTAIC